MIAKQQPAPQDEWDELEEACAQAIAALSKMQILLQRRRTVLARQQAQPAPLPEHPRKLLLTTKEAAEALGVSVTAINRMVARNEIPSLKIGHLRRFRPDTINHLLETMEAETGL